MDSRKRTESLPRWREEARPKTEGKAQWGESRWATPLGDTGARELQECVRAKVPFFSWPFWGS